MSGSKPIEIICSACGADTLLVRKPKYDGLKKVGEILSCSACGHEYETEDDVPFKHADKVKVFTEADRSAQVKVFEEDEASKLCRYCVHYVVNPFMQWCGLHKKEVEATDTCPQFVRREEKDDEDDEEGEEKTDKKTPLF